MPQAVFGALVADEDKEETAAKAAEKPMGALERLKRRK